VALVLGGTCGDGAGDGSLSPPEHPSNIGEVAIRIARASALENTRCLGLLSNIILVQSDCETTIVEGTDRLHFGSPRALGELFWHCRRVLQSLSTNNPAPFITGY
jgi:hypothetical protein